MAFSSADGSPNAALRNRTSGLEYASALSCPGILACFSYEFSMTSSRARSYLLNGGKVVAMRKVEALIHPYKLEDVKAELKNVDFEDFAISEVFLTGPRHTIKTRYRGCEYEADVPR